MNPTNEQIAEKCALSLPPDVMQHPMPLPSCLIRSSRIILSYLNEATTPLQQEIEQLKEQNAVLKSQVENVDVNWEQQQLIVKQLQHRLAQAEQDKAQTNHLLKACKAYILEPGIFEKGRLIESIDSAMKETKP